MPKRFTDSDKWKDPWFRKLKPISKMMFLYLCDQCDNAGFWEIDLERASFDIGHSAKSLQTALEDLRSRYDTDGKYIWIRKFIEFQGNYPFKENVQAHKGIIRLLTARVGLSEDVDRMLNGHGLSKSCARVGDGLPDPPSQGQGHSKGIGQGSGLGLELSKDTSENTPLEIVLKRLNELREQNWTWAQYTPLTSKSKTNTEHITALLNDGGTDDQLVVVLEYLAEKNKGHEPSRQYFNCVTPFRPKNWENNLAMAADWDAKGRPSLKPSGNGTKPAMPDLDGEAQTYANVGRKP